MIKNRKAKPWIKAVTSDLNSETLVLKRRYCGLCKTEMDYDQGLDAWICKQTTCGAILYRGHKIGPTKGEQEELVTITDPYGDLQRPFVKSIINKEREDFHGLQRPISDKHRIARHPQGDDIPKHKDE